MKFTFICEDDLEEFKVVYEFNELVWWNTLPHFEQFLRGAGYFISRGSIVHEEHPDE